MPEEKRKLYRRFGLLGVLGIAAALAATACGGVSKSDMATLQTQVLSKADNTAMVAMSSTTQQEMAAHKKDIASLQQQVQNSPSVDATKKLVADKFTTFEKGVPLWDIQPGTAPRMREFTESFNLMWFAGQAQNWEFAGFEVYRVGEEVKGILVTRPGRAAALNEWANPNLKALEAAVKAKDKAAFTAAYDNAIAGCNACHAKSQGGGFEIKAIKVVRPTAPLFPNLDYTGQ